MPAGDNKVARYVSPGTGTESGLQAHDYEDTGRVDSQGVPILRPRVASPDLVPLLDSVEGFLDGVEGLLTTIRDNADTLEASFDTLNGQVYRRTDPLPAGTNNIGYTGSTLAQKVGQGRFHIAGSGRLSLGVAGNMRLLITNPAASAKTANIIRIALFTTVTCYATIHVNPTTGLPASAVRPSMNGIVGGGTAPAVQLSADTADTALAGGTDTGIVIGLPANSRSSIDLPPLVLPAGVSLGLNAPFTGAGDMTISLYWWED